MRGVAATITGLGIALAACAGPIAPSATRAVPSRPVTSAPGESPDTAVGPSLLDVVAGSINIMQVRIARSRLAGEPADVLIAPRLAQVGLFDYHRGEEAIEEGMEAVRVMQPAILRALERDAGTPTGKD